MNWLSLTIVLLFPHINLAMTAEQNNQPLSPDICNRNADGTKPIEERSKPPRPKTNTIPKKCWFP